MVWSWQKGVNIMDDNFLKEFGERAMQRRLELGLSQLDVAKKLGYKTRQGYSLIENGERGLSQSKCVALANALDTTVSYLMGIDYEDTFGSDVDRANKVSEIERLFGLLTPEQQQLVTNLIHSLLEARR